MTIAVFDIGKTNLKISAVDPDGRILETASAPNLLLRGAVYNTIDLPHAEAFLLDGLRTLGARHQITDIITATHGGLGFLVGRSGTVTPLPDYESPGPGAVDAAYRLAMDDYPTRGSHLFGGGMHTARQLLWLGMEQPAVLEQAETLLMGPQFWAWRLGGIASGEVSMLAALTHLWDVPARRYAPILRRQGWERLMPPLRRAWDDLGFLSPNLSAQLGFAIPPRIRCGVHDSTANFYRYQSAGLDRFTLMSSGTWLVGMSNQRPPEAAEEDRGMSLNTDVFGAPLVAALAMGGREFSLLKGDGDATATATDLERLIAQRTFALPSFVETDGFVPGSAARGRIAGPVPEDGAERRALAALYIALLADLGMDLLGSTGTAILDGSFTLDPLFSSLIAQLRPQQDVRLSDEAAGTSVGAALVAGHGTRIAPPPITLRPSTPLALTGLDAYRQEWRHLCNSTARIDA